MPDKEKIKAKPSNESNDVLDKKDSGYKTLPLDQYIEHTKKYDGQFDDFFPKDKMDELNKTNDDFASKYGEYAKNRFWWGDASNQMVPSENRRLGDVILGVAKEQNIDPSFLYGSALEEGAFKTLHGKSVSGNEEVDPKYPINGMVALGLDNFGNDYEKLKQYLPKDFDYKPIEKTNNKGEKVTTASFKSPKDALVAMSAYMKSKGSEVDDLAKQKGLKLSDKAKQFFTAANYNSSLKDTQRMMEIYNDKGLLKNDKFLTEDSLGKDKYGTVYENVRRRFDAVEGLKKEGKLDLSDERAKTANNVSWTKDFQGYVKQDNGKVKVIEPKDKSIPFDIVYSGKEKKVLPRGTDVSKVDVSKLPDLDLFDQKANITAAKNYK